MNEWMNSSERASVERTTSVDANAETTKPIGIVCFVASTGVYGDVQRVKILYNKKDSALIQMAEAHQAYLGK